MDGVNDVFFLFLYSKQEQEECSEVKDGDDDGNQDYLYDVYLDVQPFWLDVLL